MSLTLPETYFIMKLHACSAGVVGGEKEGISVGDSGPG